MGDLKNQCCVGVDVVVAAFAVVVLVIVKSTNIDAQKCESLLFNIF